MLKRTASVSSLGPFGRHECYSRFCEANPAKVRVVSLVKEGRESAIEKDASIRVAKVTGSMTNFANENARLFGVPPRGQLKSQVRSGPRPGTLE